MTETNSETNKKVKPTSQIQIRVDRESWNFLRTVYEKQIDTIISNMIIAKAQEIKSSLQVKEI